MYVRTQPVPPVPRKAGHVLHLLLSLITMGLRIPVWIVVALYVDSQNNAAMRQYQSRRAAIA